MSSVPIVQGVVVSQPGKANPGVPTTDVYHADMTPPMNDYGSGQPQQGMHQKQPNQFRDVFWAILFIAHFIPLIMYAVYTSTQEESDGDQVTPISIGPHIVWLSIVAAVSVGLASISLEGMMHFADTLVKVSLIFSVIFSGLIGVFGLMSGQIIMAIMGFLSCAIGCWYAFVIWHRIPYAAANLRTALTAVRVNMGLVVVAYLFMVFAFVWTLLFILGFGNSLQQASYPVLFCWLISFYWVHQVLQYTVHVMCAGVVATWWLSPLEASSFFSSALQDSTVRALTYSFGSICFGALLVAVVRALRVTLEHARNNDDAQFLVCILTCILRCIEDMIDYLNKWAYIYVGIYGFSYIEAGREVINLFKQRGWDVIITDDLVDNVLFMITILIGLVGGLLAYFIGADSLGNAGVEIDAGIDAGMAAFGIGFLMGLMFSTIALSVVGSAVNTVIVCYAEKPAEFQANHPQLSADMRAAWTGAWPEIPLN